MNTIRQEITVRESGIIEIRSPHLQQGMCAEVFVILKNYKQFRQNSLRAVTANGKDDADGKCDPLPGLFSGSEDLAAGSEDILQAEINRKSGWTWKEKL